eukprot:gene4153-4401_t
MEAAMDGKVATMQHAVRCILAALGEDVNREGLRDTPKRVAKAYLAMTEGYRQDSSKLLNQALFNEPIIEQGSGGLVLVRDIDFASMSSYNLLPFYGRAHIAYVPSNGVVLGLSKLARLTKLCGKQLQDASSLATQVLQALQTQLAPQGALVVLQTRHLSYTDQLSQGQQYTAAASGCLALAGNTCLQEALDLLGLPVDLDSQQLGHATAADVEHAPGWLQLHAPGLDIDGPNKSMEAALQLLLSESGVMVVVDAVHMCMVARGVENHAGSTSTRAALGLFETSPLLRCQVLKRLKNLTPATRPGQATAR